MKTRNCETVPAEFGSRMKRIRIDNGLSQFAFSCSLGVTPRHIVRLEKGETIPTVTLAKLICLMYKVNYDWLLGYADDCEMYSQSDELPFR